MERVTVHGDGFALILKADETTLSIEGVSNILSESENSMIAKNINLVQINEETYSAIETNGNVLVCGTVNNNDGYIASDKIITITEEDYINYLTSRKVMFNANGGMLGMETDYKMVPYNGLMGELPIVSRDYFTFDGWYTAAEGGEKVTAETLMTSLVDVTLYAHWIENDVSAWVLKSEMPADAQVVDTKYSYILTEYTTSGSSSLSGWEKYNETWEWGPWGSWSGWQDSSVGSSDSRQVETRAVVSGYNKKTQWHYHRYRNSSGTRGWPIRGTDTPNLQNSGWLDAPLVYQGIGSSSGYAQYEKGAIDGCPIYWYNEQTRQIGDTNSPIYKTQYRYRDRSKVYTYYYKRNLSKEAAEYPVAPSGCDISNIQEWVQYRAK